jgi:glycosyltransferase involved in cell wall biosynthesis
MEERHGIRRRVLNDVIDPEHLLRMIIAFPHRPGAGGPGSFQSRLQCEFENRGWEVCFFSDKDIRPDVILIIGGTRRLLRLHGLRRQGVPVILRLDGIFWLHRKIWPGLLFFLISESRNFLVKALHAFFCDWVIYQSKFVEHWWQEQGWRITHDYSVLHNGVDLDDFRPGLTNEKTDGNSTCRHIICVEGSIDYSPYAIRLINELAKSLEGSDISVVLYGAFSNPASRDDLSSLIDYRGKVLRNEVSNVYSDGIYLSLDVNAACPNTVIEAMSCGIPVVGFDTGALAELVPEGCGKVVDFGGDPWALDFPDIESLLTAIQYVAENFAICSANARRHAEQYFDIAQVADRYIDVIERIAGNGVAANS